MPTRSPISQLQPVREFSISTGITMSYATPHTQEPFDWQQSICPSNPARLERWDSGYDPEALAQNIPWGMLLRMQLHGCVHELPLYGNFHLPYHFQYPKYYEWHPISFPPVSDAKPNPPTTVDIIPQYINGKPQLLSSTRRGHISPNFLHKIDRQVIWYHWTWSSWIRLRSDSQHQSISLTLWLGHKFLASLHAIHSAVSWRVFLALEIDSLVSMCSTVVL